MALSVDVTWKPNPVAAIIHLAWSATAADAPSAVMQLASNPPWPPDKPQWRQLQASAAAADHWQEFATAAESLRWREWLENVQETVLAWQPQLMEGLAARVRPLREQWEARSPGFCKRLGEQVGYAGKLPLELSLTPPALGGFAMAHLQSDEPRATMEAMLYHPNPMIPEPVRIGWLVTQWAARLAGLEATDQQVLAWTQDVAQHVEWLDAEDPRVQQAWQQHWASPQL